MVNYKWSEVVPISRARLKEIDGACPWCAIGDHQFCSVTAAVEAPCTCAEADHK